MAVETDQTLSVEEVLAELELAAPGVPLLSLGQTIFWDEPMKAGLAQALNRLSPNRKFVAGVHDTDYFAKFPGGQHQPGKFRALPHNDTTTRGLWSAAGEFSSLFGSETVVGRETLSNAGLRVQKLLLARPTILDEGTEAWGWRGVASLDEHPPITAHVPLKQVWKELRDTLDWALDSTLDCLTGEDRAAAEANAEKLRGFLCDTREEAGCSTLAECYRSMLPAILDFCAGSPVMAETTATTDLLRFNQNTCDLPRFKLVNWFVDPATAHEAATAYDEAIEGSGLYALARFGTGAIPFDLVIPGHGRGTVRLGTHGLIIETPTPQAVSFKSSPRSVAELANVIEEKFGTDCTLVGKAVTLIGMLGTEYVFVFHEGASGYVNITRKLLQSWNGLKVHPILRVRYDAWDALQVSCSWLNLPEPFQRPFGTEEVCSPSFARRWRAVADEQESLLEKLGALQRPGELIRFLDSELGGSWNSLGAEYEEIHKKLATLEEDLLVMRTRRKQLFDEIRRLRAKRTALEREKGEHFRARIFEKSATEADRNERQRRIEEIGSISAELSEANGDLAALRVEQDKLVSDPAIVSAHERRRSLELEGELKRMRLIKDAVVASRGLHRSNRRPSAWWFPLVCPDGLWFRETVGSARCYLEPLQG